MWDLAMQHSSFVDLLGALLFSFHDCSDKAGKPSVMVGKDYWGMKVARGMRVVKVAMGMKVVKGTKDTQAVKGMMDMKAFGVAAFVW